MVKDIMAFPEMIMDVNEEQNYHPSSFNLALGSCYTYQRKVLRTLSPIVTDLIVSQYDERSLFMKGWTFYVFVHNEGQFVPSLGLSPEYYGQHMMIFKYEKKSYKRCLCDQYVFSACNV